MGWTMHRLWRKRRLVSRWVQARRLPRLRRRWYSPTTTSRQLLLRLRKDERSTTTWSSSFAIWSRRTLVKSSVSSWPRHLECPRLWSPSNCCGSTWLLMVFQPLLLGRYTQILTGVRIMAMVRVSFGFLKVVLQHTFFIKQTNLCMCITKIVII